ncbi:pantoate--beta-alanine ligase [uncultured Sunxiuqinia sp.]|uniref:pantoate--beta-alanine ligase n=1 Tax=uncultured Sunxiuqinia sp. TaxID=1573825 RepID=UPI002625D775|nr:pantoate--beta-alanine ligase [uncultured Sunxiuqinia sp.]
MLVVKEIKELQERIAREKQEGRTIGFVPTMGALHQGHLSLIEKAGQQTDFVVTSIFVNPTQFNDKKDLTNYPRTLDKDLELLQETACQLVFAPEVKTIYPQEDKRQFNFGKLEQVLEGQFRPGHFNGVAQVVSKLFDMTKPDQAFFGQKDFQQLVIIKALVKQLNLPIEIVACPTMREEDGLAMSSRNQRLTDEQRQNAPHIYQTLKQARNKARSMSVNEVKQWVIETIDQNEFLQTEYFEITDDENLDTIESWNSPLNKVGSLAVHCGEVRLIDNIVFE